MSGIGGRNENGESTETHRVAETQQKEAEGQSGEREPGSRRGCRRDVKGKSVSAEWQASVVGRKRIALAEGAERAWR